MKKYLCFLWATYISLILFAENVSMDEAMTYALLYHYSQDSSASVGTRNILEDSVANLSVNGNLYFVNFSDGWMIMPNNNAITPVLAYSPTGSFSLDDDLPDALVELLQYYDQCVENSDVQYVHPKWLANAPQTVDTSVVLERMAEVQWGQSGSNDNRYDCNPTFNASCPSFFGNTCGKDLVGCGAVAIGQIMWYYQWPLCAIVPENMVDIYGNTSGEVLHSFDWGIIPAELHSYTDVQSYTALADFLRDCGYLARSQYGASVTNSYTSGLLVALQKMQYVSDYWIRDTNPDFISIVQSSIENGAPVIFLGRNSTDTGGHFYVVYGFNTDNRYYINWGWRGYKKDATYTLDVLEGYAYYKWALCNITPNKNCSPVHLSNQSISSDFYVVTADSVIMENFEKTGSGKVYIYSGKEIKLTHDVELNSGIEFEVKNIGCSE